MVDANAPAEHAGRGARFLAAFLDGIIFMVMVYMPLIIGGGMNQMVTPDGQFNPAAMFTGMGAIIALVGLVVFIVLNFIFVKRNGQTIAKKLLGIKVVRTDGSKASLGRIFWLRNVVNGILNIIPLYGLIDPLVIFGEKRQCIHDKIADTIVVKA